jgi:hypothetical protein
MSAADIFSWRRWSERKASTARRTNRVAIRPSGLQNANYATGHWPLLGRKVSLLPAGDFPASRDCFPATCKLEIAEKPLQQAHFWVKENLVQAHFR